MNDFLRDKLCEVLAAHGRPLLEDRPRCEALLWLAAGENSRGMFALLGALDRKVPQALLTAPPERRDAELLAKLARRLMDDLDMDEAAARWAVDAWARAIADAPAQPRVSEGPPACEPAPAAQARPAPRPTPTMPPEFAGLPSLTLDDEPAPARPRRDTAPVNLDKFFTGRTPEGLFLQGGTEGVSCLDYSRDGLTLATGHDDGTIKLWDASTGRLQGVLAGHTTGVRALAFARHSRQLASGGDDGHVKLWHTVTRHVQATLEGHDGPVTSVAYSPDGSTLVSGGADGSARLWHAESGTFRRTLQGHSGEITCLAYSPDGRTLASGSLDQTVKLWDVDFGSFWATLTGHTDGVTALAYAPEGELLVTGSRDHTLRLWNATTAREVATFGGESDGPTQPVWCLAFAPNGWTVASGGADEAVRVWDVSARRERCCFTGHTGSVRGLAFTPDGRWLVSAGVDGTVRRWHAPEADRPAPPRRGRAAKARANSVGKAGAWGGSVLVVLYLLFRLIVALSGPASPQRQFNPPPMPAWGGNLPLPDPLRDQALVLVGHTDGVAAVAVAPDGDTALSGGFDKTARLWDLTTGQELRRFDGHTAPVLAVALSPDGRRALSASLDRTVRLWDVQNGRELRRFDDFQTGITCVAFSPDGARFAAGCGFAEMIHKIKHDPGQLPLENMEWRPPPLRVGSVSVWDVATGRRECEYQVHGDEVTSLAFTPGGKRLVSGSFDKTAMLWDLKAGKEIHRFRGHTGAVFGVAVSADGKRVLTCSGTLGPADAKKNDADKGGLKEPKQPTPQDNTVRLWDLETGAELRTFHGHLNVVFGVAFSPDGERALSASFDTSVRLWDVETGAELRRYTGHNAAVTAVAFTPDGRRAVSGGWDHHLRVWRLP